MKAAVLTELNAPLEIMKLCSPELSNLGVGQVLVDIYAAGICGAQLGEIAGAAGEDRYLPHLLGHEGAGIVKKIGPGVTVVAPGDRVVLHWRKGDGIESDTLPMYVREDNYDQVGAGRVTTFCEQAIVSENRVTKIDEDIPFPIAALMGCAVTTGLSLINNEAKLKIGQKIWVAGCGGVGLNVVQGAALAGASEIYAEDLNVDKIQFAGHFGATSGPIANHINSVDVFVDCTGDPEVIERRFKSVKPGGKMILVGQPKEGVDLIFHNARQHYQGKTIIDSQGGLTNPTEDIPRYLDLWKKGKLNLNDLMTHKFSLEHINKAIEVAKSGIAGRVMLSMKHG